jgi:hypothetical protein
VSGYDEINWEKAACEGAPTNLFYIVEEERTVLQLIGADSLRRICVTCPIWNKCLAYAMRHETYGVWGGLLSKERLALKKNDGSYAQETATNELTKYGIHREEIEAITNEYQNYERGLANKLTDDRKDDTARNR